MWLKWTHRYDTSGPEVWTIVFIKNLSLNFTVEVLIEGDKESMHCQEMVTGFSKKNSFLLLLLFSRSVVSNSLWPHGLQHARLPCPSSTPGVYSNSLSLSWWCHPTISSSVVPFPSHLQSFPASGSFPMSQLFTSGGQRIGASASASVLPMNIQGWFPLGLTGLISLLSKGLSGVFSGTTVWKHTVGPQ